MDSWQKFNETKLQKIEESYSGLNIEDITDADYKHAKRVWKDSKMKHLSDYHILNVQNNTFLLATMFENFCSKCIDIDIGMLQMLAAKTICHVIRRYAEVNNKCLKDYNKNKKPSYRMYWYTNNLYGCVVGNLLADNLEWEKISQTFIRVL